MSQLPLEVLADILSRLPQKSILRFRSVSTSWLSLIDSYEFLKLRLNGSVRAHTNVTLMLRDPDCLHLINFSSHDDILMTFNCDLLSQCNTDVKIYGSCNGLICLSDQSKNMNFWNPLTGKCQKIPPTSCELQSDDGREVYGFGYDTISHDYKVVKIAYTALANYYLDPCVEVKVYSSKSNSWHKVEPIPYGHYIRPNDGILVSGALHWAIDESRYSSKLGQIVAFDLNSEEYRLVPPPVFVVSDTGYYTCLGILGGCLAVICENSRISFDVWVMKDYGVRGSWTKLVYRPYLLSGGIGFYYAIAYSKDGSEVLVHDPCHKILLFDLKRKNFKPFSVNGMKNLGGMETWLASAVPDNQDDEDVRLSSNLHPRNLGKLVKIFSKYLGMQISDWKNKMYKKYLL